MSEVKRPAPVVRRRPLLSVVAAALVLSWMVPLTASAASSTEPGSSMIYSIRVDDPITTVTADYIERALERSDDDGVTALLVELDTPGGDLASTQRIIGLLLNAKIPTVVWVGPSGAQAASAGTFIVLAAHASGMAPQTTIGAASPVGSGGADLPETLGRKATEDMSAVARGLGDRRGDDVAEWAEKAVRDAASLSAAEAFELGLIDAVADDPSALLESVDGKIVEVADESVELSTADADLEPVPMTRGEKLLSILIHPAVALLLITIGVNAIMIELSSPGGFVPGMIGVLALALGLYSLGVLNANLIGLVFLAGAFALFVLDLKAPTHGLLTAGGVVLFVVGSAILFSGDFYAVPWGTILALALGTGLFFAFAIAAVVRTMRRQPVTGIEGMLGQSAHVCRRLSPAGQVSIEGEIWDARAQGSEEIEVGAVVRVLEMDGYTLVVEPAGVETVDSWAHLQLRR